MIFLMVRIEIPIKALSVNDAHEGRHIKTAAFHQFENDVCKLLPFYKGQVSDSERFVKYVFYIKNYRNSDVANLEKILTDLLVKRGYFKDDKFIKAMYLEKISVHDVLEEKIITDIVLYADRYKIL